jgi:hypothetical protein
MDQFDPNDEKHVQWLRGSFEKMEYYTSPDSQKNGKEFVRYVNSNPFGLSVTASNVMDWPMIHSMIATKYAKAVLTGQAWLP